MFKIIILLIEIVSLCLLVLLLNITTPATAGPFGILTIFIFIYTILIGLITYFIFWISRIVEHLSIVFISKKPFRALTLKRSYYYSTILAAALILLIGLQSVSSVGVYEFLLILIFIGIGSLYVSKKV